MRVLIDANVLISTTLNANSIPFRAYVKAASYPNHGLICEQNVNEMNRIFNKKFPNRPIALLCNVEDSHISVRLGSKQLLLFSSQPQRHLGLFTGDGGDGDGVAQACHDLFGEIEADAGGAVLAPAIAAGKAALENPWKVLWTDADAGVADQEGVGSGFGEGYGDAAGFGVL